MSKYHALGNWLTERANDSESLTFDQIEAILGSGLPQSARKFPAYWSIGNLIGQELAKAGWRASPDFASSLVRFRKNDALPIRPKHNIHAKTTPTSLLGEPDIVLIGCVKTKASTTQEAQYLFNSPLFKARADYARSTGKPWYILSSKYGLVLPDQRIDPYDIYLGDLPAADRNEWSEKIVYALKQRVDALAGQAIEIHAGAYYRNSGLTKSLLACGAEVSAPLADVTGVGNQIAWYRSHTLSKANHDDPLIAPDVATTPSAVKHPRPDTIEVVAELTRAFFEDSFDLKLRPGPASAGWESMPEVLAVKRLRTLNATSAQVRIFLTLCCALDRARDADQLWTAATKAYETAPWLFDPGEVRRRSLSTLRDTLALLKISRRHNADSSAWRLISEALINEKSPRAIKSAIFDGKGDAESLLAAVGSKTPAGQAWYPLLSGPKISVMWVRILAVPGDANISNTNIIPVAVDVQVRKVSEYLGIAGNSSMDLETARPLVQAAWEHGAAAAKGPKAIAGTSAAIDPAVWFFGKWGCTFCEKAGKRLPISTVCNDCRFKGVTQK